MRADIIAQELKKLVLTIPQGSRDPANKALHDMRTYVEHKLSTLSHLNGSPEVDYQVYGDEWKGVMKDTSRFEPNALAQIITCTWQELRLSPLPQRVKYNPQMAKRSDSGGNLFTNSGQPRTDRTEYPSDTVLTKYVKDYLTELFLAPGAPLGEIGELLNGIDLNFNATHRVLVSVDFYYSRPLGQLGLHKDTTGTTLFVGLHYNNDKEIVGPEYIYDFQPLQDRSGDDEDKPRRHHAPWSVDESFGVSYWPKPLLVGLEMAREQIKKEEYSRRDMLHATTMPANGLVAFVDELIFHQTPLTRRRESPQDRQSLMSVAISGASGLTIENMGMLKPKTHRTELRRQFSREQMDTQWAARGAGTTGRRSFVRFWAMVEPKDWHL